MTNQPVVWVPSGGYHLAAVRDLESEAKALGIIEDASEEYFEGFWRDNDRLMLQMYPTPDPEARKLRYNAKPVQELPPVPPAVMADEKGEPVLVEQPQPPLTGSWSGQKIDFPQDYADDMADWIKLEPTSMRRDQVLREIAVIEAMIAGQQGMTAPPVLPAQAPATSGVVADLPDIGWSGQ